MLMAAPRRDCRFAFLPNSPALALASPQIIGSWIAKWVGQEECTGRPVFMRGFWLGTAGSVVSCEPFVRGCVGTWVVLGYSLGKGCVGRPGAVH